MPNIKVHWKGCPHHRLPRIRVISTPRNSVRTRSQLAAEEVLRVPLGSPLEQARKKQRFNFRLRRRRVRSSRSTGTSAVVRSRRHAIQRAKQHIQVFGWGVSQAELASRRTYEAASVRPESSRSVGTTSALRDRQPQHHSIIPSTDGAASSSIRRVKTYSRDPEKLYSLMHVAKVPLCCESRNTENRRGSTRLSSNSVRRPGAEYAHVGPRETDSRRNTFRGSQALERRRTYDCRIDPKIRVESRSKSGPARIRERTSRSGTIQSTPRTTQSGISADLQEAVNSLGLQSKPDSPSNESVVPFSRGRTISRTPSRTPSQQKALKKFTREINLYLQACRSLPKGTLLATPSITTISAHTIDELKPYQAQFQSAGLAVTSDQQRRSSKLPVEQSPPTPPPKDEKCSTPSLSDDKMALQKEKRREPSYASGSTGTTVLGWTPPHEKSSPLPKTARQPSSESDHTVIGFTPPHERAVPPTRPPPSPPKPPTKKSLPWLRNPEVSPLSVSPTKNMSAAPSADRPEPSTPLEGWFSTSGSPKKDKTTEKLGKSDPIVPPRPISKRSTKVAGWPGISTQQAEISTQTDVVNVIKYAEVTTQTDLDEVPQLKAVETMAKNDEVEMTRAPMASGRKKKFPMVKSKCKDDCRPCSEPVVTSSGSNFRKQSRVKWEGVDEQIQTDDMAPIDSRPEDENQYTAKPSAPRTEHPTSMAPSPTLCTKCANEFKPATPDRVPQPRAKSEPEPTPKAASSHALCHACTSSSSLICQQCFPSIQVSATICPLQTCPWNVADQESRHPTRETILAGPAPYPEEPEELAEPITVVQVVQEVFKSDELPKEKFMRVEAAKEVAVKFIDEPPIPDPMKMTAQPKLKLKQAPTSQNQPQRARYSTSSWSKSLPQPPQPHVEVDRPISLPDFASNSSLDTSLARRTGKITDKQVFKGLHVATAAACDEDVDKWIEDITGCGVRKFLADLSRFDGLGVNTLADAAKRAARQRREQVRAWEVVREARVAQMEVDAFSGVSGRNPNESFVEKEGQIEWVVGEMGVVASDGFEEGLTCKVVHSRDCKGSEGGRRDGSAGC